jgi:hypothetical protein
MGTPMGKSPGEHNRPAIFKSLAYAPARVARARDARHAGGAGLRDRRSQGL